MNNRILGNQGEMLARELLTAKGYEILEKNYNCPYGEADIIARLENTVIFIEVKFRRSTKFGYPREAVTKRKQEKLRLTAEHYIQEKKLSNFDIRFDVVEILQTGNKITTEHLEYAF